MSVIKGLWTNWKPVNEENNHGLDKQEVNLINFVSKYSLLTIKLSL